MTVYRAQPGGWRDPASSVFDLPKDEGQPDRKRRLVVGVVFLALLSLSVLCVAAFLVVRIFSPASLSWLPGGAGELLPAASPGHRASPTPSAEASDLAQVAISPAQGVANTLISVTGMGWLPQEPVFVFLRSPNDPEGRGYSYAAAVADESGRFSTAFTFPNEARWLGAQWADVIAQGTRSARQATARFTLLIPTATHTLLPTVRPSLGPTQTPEPAATSTPTATPAVAITEWRGEYFDNPSLAGSPALVRNDISVDFEWGQGAPAPAIPEDGFSARWTRSIALAGGAYLLTAGADDGMRLWIDSQLIVDDWRDGSFRSVTVDVNLAGGQHLLVMEYYENLGAASVHLDWAVAEPTASPTPSPTITPSPVVTDTPSPTPSVTPGPAGDWQGEYYDNRELQGEPVFRDARPDLTVDWGTGSPDPSRVPVDGFSARWLRRVWLANGTYLITVEVDDGVRLWVDGVQLLDEWGSSGGATYEVPVSLAEGLHDFRVDYFENVDRARINLFIQLKASSP